MAFKYEINPHHESGRDTLCQALREIWREADALKDEAASERIKALSAKSFDFAKRIVAKAQEHKAARGITGPLIQDGHPDADD
ncbi:MAG: hypothetical protein ACK4FB_08110 [Brevundimonas sp.]|uniref:hypothetical protein n=1 Tax=Brevundimonas sp. TaxID=1871086 RepID=UPI00391C1342